MTLTKQQGQAEVTFKELMDVAEKMQQELTEFVEAGEESGSDMSNPRAVLNEFEALWKRTDRYWQHAILKHDDDSCWLAEGL